MNLGLGLLTDSSPWASLLGEFPGAAMAADFTRGIYYAEGGKSLGQFLVNTPSGEPTSLGMLVDGSDNPTLVQGAGPIPFPGYDPADPELTFSCEWEGVPALSGAHRGLVEFRLNTSLTTDRAYLFIESSNQLKLGVADAVTWRSGPAFGVGTYDDAGRHRATCYINRTTGDIKLAVDGGTPVTANKVGQMPSGFTSMALGHSHGASQCLGKIRLTAAKSGDYFDEWR
jgi:hypothetical protein